MLTEAEILVHLDYRIPGHACLLYTGLYKGLNRNQRRRIEWQRKIDYKKSWREYQYYEQAFSQVYYVGSQYYTDQQLLDRYGKRYFVDPQGYPVIAHVYAKHALLHERGYLPFWYWDSVIVCRGPCWALPWPLRGKRKMSRWQLPPKSKKLRQHGGVVDGILAVPVFPIEWRPKDADEIEDEGL